MSGSPFSMAVSPLKVTLPAGQHDLTEHVTVRNQGTAPLAVRASAITVHQAHSGCAVTGPPKWITVSPASFTISPGQVEVTTVTVHAPTAVATTDVAALYTGQAKVAHHGNIGVEGSVGAQIVVRETSTSKGPNCSHHAAAPVSNSSGVPVGWIAVALVLLVIAGAVAVVYRSRRHAAR